MVWVWIVVYCGDSVSVAVCFGLLAVGWVCCSLVDCLAVLIVLVILFLSFSLLFCLNFWLCCCDFVFVMSVYFIL